MPQGEAGEERLGMLAPWLCRNLGYGCLEGLPGSRGRVDNSVTEALKHFRPSSSC